MKTKFYEVKDRNKGGQNYLSVRSDLDSFDEFLGEYIEGIRFESRFTVSEIDQKAFLKGIEKKAFEIEKAKEK